MASYQNLGEEYIVSAKVHMDESTPHMHLVFIPVVHKLDKKSGKMINKIACSEYWKGKESYRKLQDSFYQYVTKAGFDLERGKSREEREHLTVEEYKKVTNYQLDEMKNESNKEAELQTNDINQLKTHYRKLIKKCNTLSNNYKRVKEVTDNIIFSNTQLELSNKTLKEERKYLIVEKQKLKEENDSLKTEIEKICEYVSVLFDFPVDRFRRLCKDFINRIK